MSLFASIPSLFRKFKYALGWFIIELLGISSVTLFILLILSTILFIYSNITKTDPLDILKIKKENLKIKLRLEFLILIILFTLITGIMLGFVLKRTFRK